MLKKIKSMIAVALLSGAVSANVDAATITVNEGDTLWELSRANNTSVENLRKQNNLKSDVIRPGDKLTITKVKRYKVKKGDTLWDLAKAYGVTTSQLKKWNKLKTDKIRPGTALIVSNGLHTGNKSKKATKPVTKKKVVKAASTSKPNYKEITVKATAYTAYCEGCSGITKTGINIRKNPNKKVIAVDPKIIPLGSKVYVPGYGHAIAGDIGGAIKGKRIDVFIPSKKNATKYGVKTLKIKIIN